MNRSWISRGQEVLEIEIEGLKNIRDRLGPAFDRAIAMLASAQGRVIVTGIGKSGLVGRKIAATLSSTGTPSYFMHPVEGAHGDLGLVRSGDVAIAISYSGRSQELNAILPALRSLDVGIIALTSGLDSPLAGLADCVLDVSVPREACPMNLAPTSSTTATLAMGDALAVCLIDLKQFTPTDFKKVHPGGALGERLKSRACDLMLTDGIPSVPVYATQAQALHEQDRGNLGAVFILDERQGLAGILTDGDVRRAASRQKLDLDAPVSDIMTAGPRACSPDTSAAELLDLMEEKMITVLPVLDEGRKLIGIVHMHDLLGKGSIKFKE